MKKGFTLAEVLITLGIIGVVAALTLPILVQDYKKSVASARLKKFVSTINQAILFAEEDLGPREGWLNGEMESSESAEAFLSTYIKPYVRTSTKIEKRILFNANMATLRFDDGSQMSIKQGACYDIYFDTNGENPPNEKGRDIFMFILCTRKESCPSDFGNRNVRAFWCESANGTQKPANHDEALSLCKEQPNACTILIELNQYEIPKDYPIKL